MSGAGGLQCIVYLPADYAGVGPPASCINIIEHFEAAGLPTTLFLWSALEPIPASIKVVTGATPRRPTLNRALRRVPGVGPGLQSRDRQARARRTEQLFLDKLASASPRDTIVYIWPEVDVDLVGKVKRLGFTLVREMINCPRDTAKPLIDAAYARNGLVNEYPITLHQVWRERVELPLYDYFFASNAEVETGLVRLGISPAAVLPTSFGWNPSWLIGDGKLDIASGRQEPGYLRVAFVGSHAGRKGLGDLLYAWQLADLHGVLAIAGLVEAQVQPSLTAFAQTRDYQGVGFIRNIGDLYRACDVFVLPTYEEGGPQVTYEAAGCGLPVITTSMGAARMVEDGRNGLIVPAGDTGALATALRRVADDPAYRATLARTAQQDAEPFEYSKVAGRRAAQLREIAGSSASQTRA